MNDVLYRVPVVEGVRRSSYGPNDDAATTVIDRPALAAITPVPVARTVAL